MPKRAICALAALGLMLTAAASAAPYQDGIYRDKAPGFNDEVIVTVTVRQGKLDSLKAENKSGEESEYFKKAEEGLQTAILDKQGIDGVEAVSGATGTSESILKAMEGILKQAVYTGDGSVTGGGNATGSGNATGNGNATGSNAAPPAATLDPAMADRTLGLGSVTNFRVGPGKDADGAQVYSFNIAMAAVLFDRESRIVSADIDVYEVLSPNAKGGPKFSGWPAAGDNAVTDQTAADELSAWQTKRERGDSYGMNPSNEWYRQMDAYERFMVGKTPEELRKWFARYTSPKNGRPLKPDATDTQDKKAYDKLSQAEKTDLADVTAAATMSLSDAHGLILEAVERAYENRQAVQGMNP